MDRDYLPGPAPHPASDEGQRPPSLRPADLATRRAPPSVPFMGPMVTAALGCRIGRRPRARNVRSYMGVSDVILSFPLHPNNGMLCGREEGIYRWKGTINTEPCYQQEFRIWSNLVSIVCLNRSDSVYVFMARITGNPTSGGTDHIVLTPLQ
jgi:hypothetical protein